jgi:hypothetical protein
MKKASLFLLMFAMLIGVALADEDGDGLPGSAAPTAGATPVNTSPARIGAILVDTGHGEYATTSSCSALFNHLAGLGYTATNFNGTITAAALAGYDVLMIGTPRANSGMSFAPTEITAIVDFVNNGGGLLISGDYYNPPYNDNVKANSVATNFGITYNQDGGSPVWPNITAFSSHPVNAGIVSTGYYGWCTSILSGAAVSIADVSGTGCAEAVDYGAGHVLSFHDWNFMSDSYVGDYQNLDWLTNGFDWLSGGGVTFTLDISPDPLQSGAYATFTVTYGDPNTTTFLGLSTTGPGSVYVPFLDVTIGLANPRAVGGTRTTNSSGTASWTLPVPASGAGASAWFQAVQYQNASNVVATKVL